MLTVFKLIIHSTSLIPFVDCVNIIWTAVRLMWYMDLREIQYYTRDPLEESN